MSCLLTFTTLASGSSGNAAVISCGDTHVLLDAGISARRITTGLAALGLRPEELTAILVTHEHHDHISGLQVLTKKLRMPIIATGPTCQPIAEKASNTADLLRQCTPGRGFALGCLWIEPFATPHDAAGSVGYSIAGEDRRLVLATDLGYVTQEVLDQARGCDLLVCETNHDEDWVRSGPYPYHLKARVLGDRGHLSNEAGAELAAAAVQAGAGAVILAHLSSENNTPARARETVCCRLRAMGCDPEEDISLAVAPRKELGPTYHLDGRREPAALWTKEAAIC